MSTIVTDTITGKSTATTINSMTIRGEGSAQTSIQQGLAKAWSRFNGTGTAAIDDSFNISSLADNSTGNFTLNYTNNMGNDNYAKVDGGGHWGEQSTSDATSSAKLLTYSSSPSLADYTNVTFITIGDLA